MAISWTTYWSDPNLGLYERVATLYNAYDTTGGTDDGEWFSCAGYENVLVEFDESDTAGITISGYNGATTLADSSHGTTIGSEITADGFTEIEFKDIPRWMKVRVSTASAGTVTVRVKVRGRGLGSTA